MRGRKLPSPGVILTALAWVALAALAGRVLTAAAWLILGSLWQRKAFAAGAIRQTSDVMLLALAWGLAVLLAAFAWRAYERRRYRLGNRRTLRPLTATPNRWAWAEVAAGPGRLPGAGARTRAELARLTGTSLSPAGLLSEAVLLEREGRVTEACGLLRLVVDRAESGSLLAGLAEDRLVRLLPAAGLAGWALARRMREG